MNKLEIAILSGDDHLDKYLAEVDLKDFKHDIQDIKGKASNQEFIKDAITYLEGFLSDPPMDIAPTPDGY